MRDTIPPRINPQLARVYGVGGADEPEHAAVLGKWCEQAVRVAYHITRNREAALDLSQEAFVKALSAMPSPSEAEIGKAWFMRIVVNLCRDWIRHQVVERKALEAQPAPVSAHVDPSFGLERKEQLEKLREALLRLPLNYREALALVAIEGCSTGEAALALNIPEGTLRWRLSEARTLLKQELERTGSA